MMHEEDDESVKEDDELFGDVDEFVIEVDVKDENGNLFLAEKSERGVKCFYITRDSRNSFFRKSLTGDFPIDHGKY